MNRFKRSPLLGTVLLLAVATLAAEGWLWQHRWRQAQRGLAALEQKKQERDRLARQSPALSKENEQAIGRDLAGAEKMLTAWRALFQGSDPRILTEPAPPKAIDAYADLAAFAERIRLLAARAQVTTRPDERFGFSSHANQGPAAELAPAVFRQRIVLQYLLERLIEARPRALLAVQRERPLTATQRVLRNQPAPAGREGSKPEGDAGQAGDFFDFAEKTSLRVPGQMDSEAFRLEFSGQTQTVRTFLNSLASFDLPVIVRRVEAEPLGNGGLPSATTSPTDAGAPAPLVEQNISHFTVVVEFVELIATSGRPAP